MNTATYLTTAEVAARFGGKVTEGTLRKWRMKRQGPPCQRLGSKVVYPLAQLEDWEKQQQIVGEAA